ncbi:MAG: glucose-6-phosphate isomerase [Betaproteobacteria bacterium]|nr:glucose-6-phosphate isomerase [Betaproteobacteria bacterium]
MSTLTSSRTWLALKSHREQFAGARMTDLFAADANRFDKFSLQAGSLLLDYSKNLASAETMQLLMALARERQLGNEIQRLLTGDKINTSEDRAALHTALRGSAPVMVDGNDVMPEVKATLAQMREFCNGVRDGSIGGPGGRRFTDVINVGIGGSHLGPALATTALATYGKGGPRVHYVSNVDAGAVERLLEGLDPATTLAIVESKTFSTIETLTNATIVREWMGPSARAPGSNQLVAVTANVRLAGEFGVAPAHVFPCWDWVGGRYSLWSAMGLPVALGIGMDNFEALLHGAHEMDAHFRDAPFERSMPVILALLGIWYNDFFGAASHAILPYDESLALLPAHLQQLDMESSGKQLTRDGDAVDYDTGMIIWGATGTNAQHSFFQLLHQGTRLVPADFIAVCKPQHTNTKSHAILLANFLAQTAALMNGALKDGFPGNRPSNSILVQQLTPHTLGMLIALYEHKVFVQNTIWGINAFDQPGVELGKRLATSILPEVEAAGAVTAYDASTNGLVNFIKAHQTR